MRYVILIILTLTLPVLAEDTPTVVHLKAKLVIAQRELNVQLSTERADAITLDSVLVAWGYSVSVDTLYANTESEYVTFTLPDSLVREALLTIRETGDRGIPFIKTNNPNVIRVHRNRLSRIVKALNP